MNIILSLGLFATATSCDRGTNMAPRSELAGHTKGGIIGHVLCAGQEGFSAHQPRQAAYARKMEPHPEETPDFTPFSKMRRIKLDPESVIGRELVDRFAEFDESFVGHSRIWAVVVKLIGLTAMCCKAVIDLEKQVIELRREVRSRDKA